MCGWGERGGRAQASPAEARRSLSARASWYSSRCCSVGVAGWWASFMGEALRATGATTVGGDTDDSRPHTESMTGLAGRGDITRLEARCGDSEGLLPERVCVLGRHPRWYIS